MQAVTKTSVKELAKQELIKEKQDAAVKKLKSKYEELADAQVIVKNLQAEISDMEEELESEIQTINE